MKLLHGFGKDYLLFSSMSAYNVVAPLQSRATSSQTPDLADSYHCDCFYELRTKLTLLINHYIPRCPFYTVCFAFRRTGVHPPLFIF
ncbi:MAG: hypothetical protein AUK54_06260 [Helicobacteraceae bacterium CG2_30_36_10]|nr:MAG: hypothetical protein AUK54_06260 [Helicobacteraceae bacterium CG2_30_36_10]